MGGNKFYNYGFIPFSIMKEKILVTGGAGFIGSHLCDTLLDKGMDVICVDNFNDYYSPERKRNNIKHNQENKDFFLEETDICEKKEIEKVFKKHNPDKIVHLAARAGVRASIKDPFIYEMTNIKGTLNLLELSKEHKIKKFVFGSSSSVYGRNKEAPFSEDHRTDFPVSPYAATKKSGELMCYTYSYLYDLNIVCLRFFTVYGPRGRPDMAPYLFTQKINKGDPLKMFGDGTSRRDYTYVGDIVKGIVSALEREIKFEIFNLGNSQTVELKELISVIEKKLGKKAEIIRVEMPKEDVPMTYADISKAKKLLNYNPKTDIDEGISKFVDWYLDQERN